MFNKLKQIRDLRSSAKQMQAQLAEIMVVGTARNGIMVTVDGTQTVQGVQIVDGLDKAAIETGVKDAFNDASKKLQKELAVKMRDMGGLDAFKEMLGG